MCAVPCRVSHAVRAAKPDAGVICLPCYLTGRGPAGDATGVHPVVVDPLVAFPGEDRAFGGASLYVDLIPESCWFTNVRSCVAPDDWNRIRHLVYGRAGYRCEVCGAGGRLEAHERWAYDEPRAVQTLKRLVCLCQDCHTATHFGLARVRGVHEQAAAHLRRVNGWTREAADAHIADAFTVWEWRNRIDWALDLSMLTRAGVRVAVPERFLRRRLGEDGLRG